MTILLEYLRMASYAVIIISCVFSLIRKIKNIKGVLIGNIIFASLLLLSVMSKSFAGEDSKLVSNWLVTPGVIIWAILNWANFIKKA